MRVISGSCRGRKLVQIKGKDIRPTSDRAREAVFNILGQDVRDARVLDLFAGTGALGIEALSRGAGHATFVDKSCEAVKENLSLCRLAEKACVIRADLIRERLDRVIPNQVFNIVFIDPPYGKGYIEKVLEADSFLTLLSENAVIVAEHGFGETLHLKVPALDISRQKKYSKTMISFINRT